ncbi:aminotransferase class IV [Clostridium sp. MB05]|uniref:aminotransferase class IV n=1 Tax=Clostridium sp. MB05 TaxID=3376682 RepID=UPI0039823BAC
MRNLIYKNDKAYIDSGFFFGRGVFETILIKKTPIFLREHINRLNNGIKTLKIGEPLEENYIMSIIKEINIQNCALKIAVTEKNIILEPREVLYKSGDYIRGFSLKTSNIIRNSTSKLTYIKSLNYLDNILERESALKEGYDEVLFLNEKGYISEGSTSNIFIVKDNIVYTPNVRSGLLPGIVRDFIINNYEVYEKEITLDEVMESDEIFITNSLLGIMGISKINNKILKENKVTIKIREKYELKIEN